MSSLWLMRSLTYKEEQEETLCKELECFRQTALIGRKESLV